MTDEDDGDDVEDGRRTRWRTEQEQDEKEWRARIERMLVQMDMREKRRAELDEQQVVLGRRLVAGVDWVGELLEGMGSDGSQRGGEEEDEEVRGTEGDGDGAENGEEGDDEEMKGGEEGGEHREEGDGG